MLAEVGFELPRTLPVDVEQNVAPFAQCLLHRRLGRAVAIAEDERPFDELVGADHSVEFVLAYEVVVDSVCLAGALRPRRGRHRHRHVPVGVQQQSRDSGFSGTGRGGKDDQEAAAMAARLVGCRVHDRSCFGRAVPVKRRNGAVHKKRLEMVRRKLYCALQHIRRLSMADETKIEAKVAAEAPAKVAETIANTTEKVVKESAKVAQRTRATATRRAKREAVAQKTDVKAATRRTTRKTRTAARKTAAAAQERIQNVTKNQYFNGLDAIPAFAP